MTGSRLPTDDSQFWIVTGIAIVAVLLLLVRSMRNRSCGGCNGPTPSEGKSRE